MFWWELMAPIAPETIETMLALMPYRKLDPSIVIGPGVREAIIAAATLRGESIAEFANNIEEFGRGITLEQASTYTFRTPYYQLSGVQDRSHKGWNGFQEHHWQATLSRDAIVFTNAPGGVGFNQFTGGWQPCSRICKNVGIIQYDRRGTSIGTELINYLAHMGLNYAKGDRPYTHAYFPQWAFDETITEGHWVFGRKGDAYIALYSINPIFWISDIEIWAIGQKNLWLTELGAKNEWGSFQTFINAILGAELQVESEAIGYRVSYHSPSQGRIISHWEGDMYVNDLLVSFTPYARFDNKYCYQQFGTELTEIFFGTKRLTLDFSICLRSYVGL